MSEDYQYIQAFKKPKIEKQKEGDFIEKVKRVKLKNDDLDLSALTKNFNNFNPPSYKLDPNIYNKIARNLKEVHSKHSNDPEYKEWANSVLKHANEFEEICSKQPFANRAKSR
ncbi:MAG: hypothetical protein ACK4OM_03310 [Alphaproteobacteria bacterium]